MTTGSSTKRRGRPSKTTNPPQMSLILKRKREEGDSLESDAQLAQALQAQEYEEQGSKTATHSKLSKDSIADLGGDDSMLSELSDAETDDDIPLRKRTQSNKRTVLPARRARRAAKDSLATAGSKGVQDSEEESESDFSMSDSEEVYDDSDDMDEDIPSTTHATPAPDGPSATAGSSARPNRRRRRRALPAVTSRRWRRWQERRIEGMNDRVSQTIKKLQPPLISF